MRRRNPNASITNSTPRWRSPSSGLVRYASATPSGARISTVELRIATQGDTAPSQASPDRQCWSLRRRLFSQRLRPPNLPSPTASFHATQHSGRRTAARVIALRLPPACCSRPARLVGAASRDERRDPLSIRAGASAGYGRHWCVAGDRRGAPGMVAGDRRRQAQPGFAERSRVSSETPAGQSHGRRQRDARRTESADTSDRSPVSCVARLLPKGKAGESLPSRPHVRA
jgi:hypothetical protein